MQATDAGSDALTSSDGGVGNVGYGTVSGSVRGNAFTQIASAVWIGKPDKSSVPTIVFLSDARLDCTNVSTSLWDKQLGDSQLLELDINGRAATAYMIGTDAQANYLKHTTTADATGDVIDVQTVRQGKDIAGTFTLSFGDDKLAGDFDALYCADGVEP